MQKSELHNNVNYIDYDVHLDAGLRKFLQTYSWQTYDLTLHPKGWLNIVFNTAQGNEVWHYPQEVDLKKYVVCEPHGLFTLQGVQNFILTLMAVSICKERWQEADIRISIPELQHFDHATYSQKEIKLLLSRGKRSI
jgi:hypothetical protein